MPRRLPPLAALRAFEAVARHGAVVRAARELHVTHGAVSRQVRSLEAHLGSRLLRREGRGVVLTEAGRRYAGTLSLAFEEIDVATLALAGDRQARMLSVNVPPTFAMRWLIPRLPSFQANWPSVELRLATTSARIDFPRDGFDVAIRSLPKSFTRSALAKDEAWRDLVATPFLVETMFPVASPKLLARTSGLRAPADLRHYTLLHSLSVPQAWTEWLRAAGVTGIDAEAGPKFDHFFLALQAAAQGLGVAMATEPCLGQDLETGALVAPFPDVVIRTCEHHLIYPRRLAARPPLKAFCDWIVSVAQGNTNP